MAIKLYLDVDAMEDTFFHGATLLGIGTPLPPYQLCRLLNDQLDMNFERKPEKDIFIKGKTQKEDRYYDLYEYRLPLTESSFFLYFLKSFGKSLLTQLSSLDFLLMLQGHSDPELFQIMEVLNKVSHIHLLQSISIHQLKSKHLLLI